MPSFVFSLQNSIYLVTFEITLSLFNCSLVMCSLLLNQGIALPLFFLTSDRPPQAAWMKYWKCTWSSKTLFELLINHMLCDYTLRFCCLEKIFLSIMTRQSFYFSFPLDPGKTMCGWNQLQHFVSHKSSPA